MSARAILMLASMVAISLAGCADESAPAEEGIHDGLVDEKQVKDDLGVIRGVVVDAAIVPLSDATVILTGEKEQTATTNADGAFAFINVEPGFVELIVDKDGYEEVRTQVNVQAGVKQPPVVQVQLAEDPSELPFIQPLTFNGYLDCSISTPAYRVAVCSLPGASAVFDDNFMTTYEGLDPKADYIQSEMQWDSTQPAGDAMMFTLEADVLDGGEIAPDAQGVSPLLIQADKEMINQSRFAGSFLQRVFNYEHPATTPPVPVCGIPNPIHGGTMCAKGVGATLQQSFDIYTHVFYRTTPPSDWRFTEDGSLQ